jgi:predicted dithiol-disulfide oxidoreductase (DUF899 family)
LSRERRDLPWELVDRDYVFEGDHGNTSLHEMFDGRTQLVIYHAMFNPDTAAAHTTWTPDAACYACSWWMDNFNGITVHLNHRDITMVAVSRARYPAIAAYKKRMGWSFPWYYNYRPSPVSMSEAPGISVFIKDEDRIYHTYSTYTRGLDMLNVAYHYMDLVPKGRDEGPGGLGEWVRRHDEYSD